MPVSRPASSLNRMSQSRHLLRRRHNPRPSRQNWTRWNQLRPTLRSSNRPRKPLRRRLPSRWVSQNHSALRNRLERQSRLANRSHWASLPRRNHLGLRRLSASQPRRGRPRRSGSRSRWDSPSHSASLSQNRSDSPRRKGHRHRLHWGSPKSWASRQPERLNPGRSVSRKNSGSPQSHRLSRKRQPQKRRQKKAAGKTGQKKFPRATSKP